MFVLERASWGKVRGSNERRKGPSLSTERNRFVDILLTQSPVIKPTCKGNY